MRESNGGVSDSREEYINRVSRRAWDEMILRHSMSKTEEVRCWDPKARCHVTGKLVFGRKCIMVSAIPEHPPEAIGILRYYFLPKHYLVWTMRG